MMLSVYSGVSVECRLVCSLECLLNDAQCVLWCVF